MAPIRKRLGLRRFIDLLRRARWRQAVVGRGRGTRAIQRTPVGGQPDEAERLPRSDASPPGPLSAYVPETICELRVRRKLLPHARRIDGAELTDSDSPAPPHAEPRPCRRRPAQLGTLRTPSRPAGSAASAKRRSTAPGAVSRASSTGCGDLTLASGRRRPRSIALNLARCNAS